ncbi:MAG: glycosyltransferase family 39 protein [Anaerolineales bacterium]|nr:glycosyltransferase family 39 protein [Anaerolineales bacterium]
MLIPIPQGIIQIVNLFFSAGFLALLGAIWIRSLRQHSRPTKVGADQGPDTAAESWLSTLSRPFSPLIKKIRDIFKTIAGWRFFSILDLKTPADSWTMAEILPGYLLCGGLLLYFGQAMLPVPPETQQWIGWVYIGTGFYLFFAGASGFSRSRFPAVLALPFRKGAAWFGIKPVQFMLLAITLPLSWAASHLAGLQPLMHQPGPAAAAWIFAVLFLILGTINFPLQRSKVAIPRWEIAIAAVIFLVGLYLRVVQLDNIPWLLTGDEGSAGVSAVHFINGDQNNIFSTGWFSFPSLFYFLQSLPIRVLGNTITSLRLSSALVGSLAVLITYWALRPAFGRWTAIFASAYLATFHFHIHFSRIGLNNIWDSLFFILAFGTAVRYFKNHRLFYAGLTGIAIGLCQYFYSSSKTLIILILAWLILMLIFHRKEMRGTTPGIIILLLALIVTVLPLALYFIEMPGDFLAPYNRVTLLPDDQSLLSQEVLTMMLPNLKEQFLASLKAFTATNLRFWYNIDHPMLLTLPAALFLMGMGILLLKLFDPAVIWILLWLASSIGISMFSKDAPAAQRFPYTAPCVAAIIALPLHQVYEWLSGLWPRAQRWFLGALSLILLLAMSSDLGFYFFDYSTDRNFGDLNTEVAHRAALYLQDKPEDTLVYFLGGRMGYFSHSSIPYLAPDCTGVDLFEPIVDPPDIKRFQETIFIILPERQEELQALVTFFPQGEERLFYGKDDDVIFISYTVPPEF